MLEVSVLFDCSQNWFSVFRQPEHAVPSQLPHSSCPGNKVTVGLLSFSLARSTVGMDAHSCWFSAQGVWATCWELELSFDAQASSGAVWCVWAVEAFNHSVWGECLGVEVLVTKDVDEGVLGQVVCSCEWEDVKRAGVHVP